MFKNDLVFFLKNPSIEIVKDYKPYELGRLEDIFVKWPSREIMPGDDYDVIGTLDMLGYTLQDERVKHLFTKYDKRVVNEF